MSTLNENLLREVMSLPSHLRTKLIEELIKSLNVPIQREFDDGWVNEAERRIKEINSGEVSPISGEIVFKEIRSRFQKNDI